MYSARAISIAVTFSFLTPLTLLAQKKAPDKPTPGDEMIYKYLCAETDKLSQKFLDGAKSIDEWQKKRPRLHQEYMDMLGLWPIPEKTPLKAAITGKLEHQDVIIDNLHFQSKPGLYVTANLYRPKANDPRWLNGDPSKLPTIVYVCGHANKGRDGNKSAYQDHGMWFASNGYNCLVLDSLQLGEIPAVHHGTYGVPWNHLQAYGIKNKNKVENRFWWHAAGYTPAGVEAWNGVRAIDYLVSRPDVDADKIGVTGISGGGAATFWIACADPRVKVAVPVSGMSDLESYVTNKVINGHCDCMFLNNTYQWEWTTIAALIAPRPLLFANSDNDPIFPMDGNRRIIERLRGLYKMYDKADLLDEYVSKGGHAYRPDLRVAVFKFMNKHLKGDTKTPVKDADFPPLAGKQLRVFPTDADIPKDAINAKIDETFVPRAKVEEPAEGKFTEWKKKRQKLLNDICFQSLLIPAPTTKRTSMELVSKGGTSNKVLCFFVPEGYFKDADDVEKKAKSFCDKDDSFLVFFPRIFDIPPFNPREYVDPKLFYSWTRKSPPNYVERSHVLLGGTIDQEKLHHFLSSVARVNWNNDPKNPKPSGFILSGRQQKLDWKIVGVGQAGILAAYAALFEPSIKEVVIIDPPVSHKEGPYFLNVLRVCDIPEALGLLAPHVKLTLIGARDPAFDRTAAIYKAAGAADKLVRK